MIITKTPFRMSFFGGGSDLASYYQRSPGAVLSVTLDKYMYISSHHFFDRDQIRVKYSQTETVSDVNDLKHPILRTVLKRLGIEAGLEVSSIADIPSGTGMGSSSAFTVGLLHNLYTRKGQFAQKKTLANEACEIEIHELKEPIGKQDQYAAAFGGLNVISFSANNEVTVEPLYLNPDTHQALQDHLLLFYTGHTRSASSILQEQKSNMDLESKFSTMQKMVEMVEQSREILYQGNLDQFGALLHESWELKRTLANNVSNPEIDEFYKKALDAGAFGGKILGAGGGGFLLVCCPPNKRQNIIEALNPLRHIDFKFENDGSKVIYADEGR